MGKAARLRGQRERRDAEQRIREEANREHLEEVFGARLTDLEAALIGDEPLTIRRAGKSISGGKLARIEVAEGPILKLTIQVDP